MQYAIYLDTEEVNEIFDSPLIGVYETKEDVEENQILQDYIDYVFSMGEDYLLLKMIIVEALENGNNFNISLLK